MMSLVAKRLHRAFRAATFQLGGLQALCYTLRIPQAALVQQPTTGITGAACEIHKKAQTGLTAGLGTAFPQKGVPNIIHQNGHAPDRSQVEGD
jgi:hypothetical protein